MNHAQNKMLHGLLNKTGLMNEKANIINGITKGRSESSKDLSFDEARLMINWLKSQDKTSNDENRMRRKILSMAHECGWHNLVDGEWKIDMRALDTWCVKYSYLKKELNKYTYLELPKLVTQFTKVYRSHLNNL